jgi:NADH-quinone oxidoreductase subunit M
MILLLLLLIPLVTGLCLLPVKNAKTVRTIALVASIANFLITLFLVFGTSTESYSLLWINSMGITFSLSYDGISLIMILLTNLLFPFIILAGFNRNQNQVSLLYFLILFTQLALNGVFLAQNGFLFYIFWELALIPVYFILLLWGGEERRTITLKFFIYTLTGSLFLLFGIIFLYQLTPGIHTTDFAVFNQLVIPEHTQIWLFWILFIAFAIKMPIFPFHTWQPKTYTMASTQGVMILAGVMTKMGIYGALRFLFPIVPAGVLFWQNTVIILCLIGVIYASTIAFRQKNLKKLIAFSSMAHISLMAAALFAVNFYASQGLIFQVITHGVIVVALFYLVAIVEDRTSTLELSKMGGLKLLTPNLSILMLIVFLGSIALPLTGGFVGEFLMIIGLFHVSIWFAIFGGAAMILSAIYMLYAYQRIMLGDKNSAFQNITDIRTFDYLYLIPLIAIILALGIYPQPVLDIIGTSVKLLQPLADEVSALVH